MTTVAAASKKQRISSKDFLDLFPPFSAMTDQPHCSNCDAEMVPGEVLTPTSTAWVGAARWKNEANPSKKLMGGRNFQDSLAVEALRCPSCGVLTLYARGTEFGSDKIRR